MYKMEYNVEKYGAKKEFSDDIKDFMVKRLNNQDIYSLNLDELILYKENLQSLIDETLMLELASKLLNNAAYGASANQYFYFYNMSVASDITGEARNLTKFMWDRLERFFHEDIWERKDLWEKFGFALDESKHDWYREQTVSNYSDTDSQNQNSLLLIDNNNKMTIKELFDKCNEESGLIHTTRWSQEMVSGNGHTVKNYVNGKIVDVPIKYVMRHHVTKPMYKIRTKSGKETIVTCDHSCIVFRDGKQIVVKAKEIKKTDKILSINHGKKK